MAVMSVLGTGLTTLYVRAMNAESELNNRVQAQMEARLALDKLRKDVHCAKERSPESASGLVSLVTLTMPASCSGGGSAFSITWCTQTVDVARYALYRIPSATGSCTGGTKWADHLTTQNVFDYTPHTATDLAQLHVELPVNVRPDKPHLQYKLADDIVLRNSCRSGSACP
jgi:hypothetical protein